MDIQFLDFLNKYSNLILIIVTGVYVFLTRNMVAEMRRTREIEDEPNLIASPIPFGLRYMKIKLFNVGKGPALNVRMTMTFDPQTALDQVDRNSNWYQPVFLANDSEDFRLPGDIFEFDKIMDAHDKLLINLEWEDRKRQQYSATSNFELKELNDGWFQIGWLKHPVDVSTRLGEITDEIKGIRKDFDYFRTRYNIEENFPVPKKTSHIIKRNLRR